jgi:Domain of unknown function (DUF4136)
LRKPSEGRQWLKNAAGNKLESDDATVEKGLTNQARHAHDQKRISSKGAVILLFLICVMASPQARAKMNVDFNPDLDFTKYKTFAYIGGVEHLVMMQLDPSEIRNRVHEMVARELINRGLKEVKRDENPDLAVRYFANSNTNVNSSATLDWGGFDPFIAGYWGNSYEVWTTRTTREGSLLIDLIDVKRKDLAWRVYLEQKILHQDKVWAKVNEEITKSFESYPPTEKDKEEKRKERAEHPPKPQKPTFQ